MLSIMLCNTVCGSTFPNFCSQKLRWSNIQMMWSFARNQHSGTSTVTGELVLPSRRRNHVKSYDEIPGNWKNGWMNLYHFLKKDGVHNIHEIMIQNFNKFGPIYREKIGYYNSINIINPEDAATLFSVEGMFPERLRVKAWLAYRDHRNKKYGVLLKKGEDWRLSRLVLNAEVLSLKAVERFLPLLDEVGKDFVSRVYKKTETAGHGKWTVDLSNELFRFAMESVCYVLYGERLGLLQDHIDPAAQKFIDSVTLMFKTTSPMLYIPPEILKRMNSKTWRDHVEAWDIIFQQADRCIQNIYREVRLKEKHPDKYPGILASLLLQDKLPIDDITASVTELMAGGVDTTSMSILWTLYELAQYPALQEKVRSEVIAATNDNPDDLSKMLKSSPLLKACIKETLRLHPVAVSLQRYTTQDIVIQDYLIPSGALVQVCLYAMGRSPSVFSKPEKYSPERWISNESRYFHHLAFGFGPRQCIGRRIAEAEMMLFLTHILKNFRIETNRLADVKTTFDLILVPKKPIYLTLKPL
ncbi:cholesterol side-chain cleavage enzyme, mitochondrial [Protopterus annectens]|uniref:cholesterol side-chain cleavage enzyme, mitochondrial n=1 Tax=Protopterus annectens TaxID=7888 RepID=UPI001CFB9369|nr:cholesterol side-chain cleavage enzyme, mitochondrial [Protopterus annectens]